MTSPGLACASAEAKASAEPDVYDMRGLRSITRYCPRRGSSRSRHGPAVRVVNRQPNLVDGIRVQIEDAAGKLFCDCKLTGNSSGKRVGAHALQRQRLLPRRRIHLAVGDPNGRIEVLITIEDRQTQADRVQSGRIDLDFTDRDGTDHRRRKPRTAERQEEKENEEPIHGGAACRETSCGPTGRFPNRQVFSNATAFCFPRAPSATARECRLRMAGAAPRGPAPNRAVPRMTADRTGRPASCGYGHTPGSTH